MPSETILGSPVLGLWHNCIVKITFIRLQIQFHVKSFPHSYESSGFQCTVFVALKSNSTLPLTPILVLLSIARPFLFLNSRILAFYFASEYFAIFYPPYILHKRAKIVYISHFSSFHFSSYFYLTSFTSSRLLRFPIRKVSKTLRF